MKTVLIVLVLIAGVCAGVGYYRGWFSVSSRNSTGESNITLSVDKDKIEADKDKAVDKMENLGHKALDKVPATTQNRP